MADIKLVIKLDEGDYFYCLREEEEETATSMESAIANGTPLPKGHGNLIIEPTEEEIAETIGGRNDFADCIREAVKTVFANATPIIEADKSESEEA